MKDLKTLIEGKQQKANELTKNTIEAKKVNEYEKDKHIKYMKQNAALKAKLEFIEANYDYSSTAKQMNLQDFKELIISNNNINNSVHGFTGKLEVVQKEIQSIEI
jgi:hypothetical protein